MNINLRVMNKKMVMGYKYIDGKIRSYDKEFVADDIFLNISKKLRALYITECQKPGKHYNPWNYYSIKELIQFNDNEILELKIEKSLAFLQSNSLFLDDFKKELLDNMLTSFFIFKKLEQIEKSKKNNW